jgi:hypothetical protein
MFSLLSENPAADKKSAAGKPGFCLVQPITCSDMTLAAIVSTRGASA